MLQALYAFITVVLYFFITLTEGVWITTKYGILRGIWLKSRNGNEYLAFRGIPFAKPPVGDLRFESPQDPVKWEGVRDATHPASPCIQANIFNSNLTDEILGEEDCLYLNVYTPQKPVSRSPLLPTMVYIHGGAFISGSAMFQGPLYFMDYPVVVVIIQYRLHVLGFLSASDEVIPGNYGMKDQVAALKWVQENIANFGGDPERVTIFGESAGAASVHLHMFSPLSKGLFQQAISQSGSALANWAQTHPPVARQRAHAFAVLSGCPVEPTSALVACLRAIPAHELVKTHNKFRVWSLEPLTPFAVVIEGRNAKNAFLVDNPWYINVVSNVPWISGIVKNEGGFEATRLLSNPSMLEYFDLHYERIFPITFQYGEWLHNENASNVSQILRKCYFGEERMEKQPKKLFQIFTDGLFKVDIIEAAKRRTEGNAYFYLYDHRNVHSVQDILGSYKHENLGACHGDDLISFFPLPTLFPDVTEGPDFEVSKKMIKYWVNFASKGNPNDEENIWQPIKSNEFEYLHITTDTEVMEKHSLLGECNIWKSIPVLRNYV